MPCHQGIRGGVEKEENLQVSFHPTTRLRQEENSQRQTDHRKTDQRQTEAEAGKEERQEEATTAKLHKEETQFL